MASSSSFSSTKAAMAAFLVAVCLLNYGGMSSTEAAALCVDYYDCTCPDAYKIVQGVLVEAHKSDTRIFASLIRLHFHDCFVQGCDGSLLLDTFPGFESEKDARPNNGSARGYDVVDAAKAALEKACPGVVSCADILALTARDGAFLLGGPTWAVPLGRRDSTTANQGLANANLPAPSSNLSTLISKFANQGLSPAEMTALSGAHTIGQAQCRNFNDHIYNDTNIDPSFAALRRRTCPSSGNSNLAPIDVQTPTTFNADYYRNLIARRGLFRSDQALFNGGSQDALVRQYCANPALFRSDFVKAMVKMGNINPLTGTAGEIRANCRVVNS